MQIKDFIKVNLVNQTNITNYNVRYVKDNIIYLEDNNKYSFIKLDSKNISNKDSYLKWYDKLEDFQNGQAIARINDQYVILNEDHTWLNNGTYDSIERVNNQYFLVEGSQYHLLDKLGKIIKTFNNKPRYQPDGNYIIYYNYNNEQLFNTKTGMASEKYYDIDYFHNGLYLITKCQFNKLKIGLMDSSGKVIVPMKYLSIIYVNDNMVLVQKKLSKFQYIDLKGNVLLEQTNNIKKSSYYHVSDYQYGVAIASHTGSSHVLINEMGKEIAGTYSGINVIKDNLAVVSTFGIHKLIDFNNNELSKSYNWINAFINGVALARHPSYTCLINEQGEEILKGDDIELVNNSFYKVNKDNHIYIANYLGKIIYELEQGNYKFAEKDNLLVIHNCANDISWMIDLKGKEIIKPITNQKINIFNKDIVLIDNYIINIQDINYSYYTCIEHDNNNIVKKFDSLDDRKIYMNYLNEYIYDQVNNLYNKIINQEIVSHQFQKKLK